MHVLQALHLVVHHPNPAALTQLGLSIHVHVQVQIQIHQRGRGQLGNRSIDHLSLSLWTDPCLMLKWVCSFISGCLLTLTFNNRGGGGGGGGASLMEKGRPPIQSNANANANCGLGDADDLPFA